MRPAVVVILASLVLAPSLARAQMPANGLAVDARLGAGLIVGGTSAVVAQPSLTVGGRLVDRVQLGLGVGLYRQRSKWIC
ncbi:MAG TPA: hypothetical protein VHB97_04340 [Polyangia bacterium]|jgi:hypothetical protein|nr:hypothetical protein [Polyangia bacterium]